MSEALSSAPVPNVVSTSQIRVHKIETVSERTFWIGHIVFTALAIIGIVLIVWARGPRRRDALQSGVAVEGKE